MKHSGKSHLAATRVLALVASVIAIVAAAGCAKTSILNREQFVTGKLPRPAHIWVYDFSATAADLPANSSLAGQVEGKTQTEQEIATGRELGHKIAEQLVQEINAMGMPAMLAAADAAPQINDIVLRGHIISVDEGSAVKRMTIGFGAGASKLNTVVEGFQMTTTGLRPLGMGDIDAGGGKTPGGALGAAALIATRNPAGLIISSGVNVYEQESGKSTVEGRAQQTAKEIGAVLKKRFHEQGWIQ
jgi:hypothetical protein